MCGIFLYLSSQPYTKEFVEEQGSKCSHRGPDNTQVVEYSYDDYYSYFMFHRLAINGLTETSNQPFEQNNLICMCNGEIYNYKELAEEHNITLKTESDCEILVHLYPLYKSNIDQFLSVLDGVFAFVILDKTDNTLLIGHDPIGIRSLYMTTTEPIIISSEMKCLTEFQKPIEMVKPGVYKTINLLTKEKNESTYFPLSFNTYFPLSFNTYYKNDIGSMNMIQTTLINAVKKRLLSDRPIGCLLSGGLDSSIIVAIMCRLVEPSSIRTFSIGMGGSPDLLAAKQVATYLGTNHTSLIVSEELMLDAIEPTIQQIESFDTTTVRASVPMYLLSKHINEKTNIKVILSGEGSDELSGSYLYFHKAPSPTEFQDECIRLIKDVQYFDVLRGDKTTAGNSLEIRVPFFDKEFVKQYMSIDPELKVVRNGYEKFLLRKSFEDYLPKDIVWRRKDGFSDGVSKNEKPWYQIIEDYTQKTFQMSEKVYYKTIFQKYYDGYESICPYEWLPKWIDESNPSGRLIL